MYIFIEKCPKKSYTSRVIAGRCNGNTPAFEAGAPGPIPGPAAVNIETLIEIINGWPELKRVKVISEERIREQEHGIATLYNDRRLYFVFNPIQGLLYKLEGKYEYRYMNGENKADVRDRVRSFLSTLVREYSQQKVLIISHHLTLLCLRANLERWTREMFVKIDKTEKPINCGVTIYKGDFRKGTDGKLMLKSYNGKLY